MLAQGDERAQNVYLCIFVDFIASSGIITANPCHRKSSGRQHLLALSGSDGISRVARVESERTAKRSRRGR
jgi:hypothetical protein